MAYKLAPVTPLRGSFMVASIIGFLISIFLIIPNPLWMDYGIAFMIVFLVMIIASIFSMTHSQTGIELQIDKGEIKPKIIRPKKSAKRSKLKRRKPVKRKKAAKKRRKR